MRVRTILLLFIILLTSCASKKMVTPSGGLHEVKIVQYSCDYSKMAEGGLAYCIDDPNGNPVSHIVSPNIQATDEYFQYLSQTVALLQSENSPRLPYYMKARGDNATSPTSFATLMDNSTYLIALTKRDLASRTFIPSDNSTYWLSSVEVVNSEGAILQRFDEDDVARVIISYNKGDALIYRGDLANDGYPVIRYTHIANDAVDVQTDINVVRFYPLSNLPRQCVDAKKFTQEMTQRGFSAENAQEILSAMPYTPTKTCTENQKSIGRMLPKIF